MVVTGAPPDGQVRVETTLELAGQAWSCSGEYVADDDGQVDTAARASSGGSYTGVDPFGLFWSAELPPAYDWDVLHSMTVVARATCDDLVGDASYARMLVADGVTVADVREPDAVGRLFLPDAPGDVPGAVLVAGAVGGRGLPETAPLLASHGVAVLSLAHWNHPGLPETMRSLDVEVVARACDWLRARVGVRDLPPAVVGVARGGELALLAASLFPERVGPAASLAGSGVAWGAVGPGTDPREPAWSHAGEPVAHLARTDDDWDTLLSDPAAVAAAEVPVERATGPLLLLSGADDQHLAECQAERRDCRARRAARHPRGDLHRLSGRRPPGLRAARLPARQSDRASGRTRPGARRLPGGQPRCAARLVATAARPRGGAGPMSEHQDGIGDPDALERLWTPYRMAYIRGENKPPDGSEGECPFCRITALDDEAGLVVRRGESAYVVLNLYPYTAGHLMICPYRHIADYTEVTDEESAEIGAMTREAMRTVRAVSRAEGFNVGMNQGAAGGAGIRAHLHQHVVPRWIGDSNFMPVIGRTKTVPQLLRDTRALLAEAWQG